MGHVIPVPTDGGDGGEDDPLAMLKRDVEAAKGRTILAETTAAGFGEGKSAAPGRDWVPSGRTRRPRCRRSGTMRA